MYIWSLYKNQIYVINIIPYNSPLVRYSRRSLWRERHICAKSRYLLRVKESHLSSVYVLMFSRHAWCKKFIPNKRHWDGCIEMTMRKNRVWDSNPVSVPGPKEIRKSCSGILYWGNHPGIEETLGHYGSIN